MDNDTRKLLRRLSGALGRQVTEDELDIVRGDHGSVVLADGTYVGLMAGNVAYTDGSWWKNGRRLSDTEADQHFAARS